MTGATTKGAAFGLILGATLALTACGEAEVADAAPVDTVPDLEVSNARLVLPPVSGNPAAVYFDVVYNGERGVSISGADVAGAGSAAVHAMMEFNFEMTMGESGPIALPAGEAKSFEPGGLHVMAFELGEGFEAGGSAEVTLNISGGKIHKFDAEIRAAGEER